MAGNRIAPAELERAITADRWKMFVLQLCTLIVVIAALAATIALVPTSTEKGLLVVCLVVLSASSFVFLLVSVCRLLAWLLVGRSMLRKKGTTRIPYPDPVLRHSRILGNYLFALSFQAGLNGLLMLVEMMAGNSATIIMELLFVIPIIPLAILYRRSKKRAAFISTALAVPPDPESQKEDRRNGKHLFIFFLMLFLLSGTALIVSLCLHKTDQITALVELVSTSGFMTLVPLFRRRITNIDYLKFFESMED